jgi:glycerophosphoryl diester phosphodiesterase
MDRVLISSFDQRILRRIAALDAPPAVAYVSNHGAGKSVLAVLGAIKAFSWHPRFKVLTRDQVELLHAAGLKVFPWTINTRGEAQKILAMGVDGLICNELRVMRADSR